MNCAVVGKQVQYCPKYESGYATKAKGIHRNISKNSANNQIYITTKVDSAVVFYFFSGIIKSRSTRVGLFYPFIPTFSSKYSNEPLGNISVVIWKYSDTNAEFDCDNFKLITSGQEYASIKTEYYYKNRYSNFHLLPSELPSSLSNKENLYMTSCVTEFPIENEKVKSFELYSEKANLTYQLERIYFETQELEFRFLGP